MEFIFLYMSKDEAMNLLRNADLTEKKKTEHYKIIKQKSL